jgi:hypothetical protein
LDWWIRLANLHRQDVLKVVDPLTGDRGFSDKVEKLRGPRPEGVHALLNKSGSLRDLLIGAKSDPDKYLWGLAWVADSVLSKISELGQRNSIRRK